MSLLVFVPLVRYLDSASSSSEAISTHSLRDVPGLLNCTSCILVNWSQFIWLLHSITLFTMCHVDGVSQCCPMSTHIDGQCRAGKMFETCDLNHQAGKRAILLNLPSLSTIRSFRQTLSSTIFDVEREPLNEPTSLESNCSISTFQAGPHIGCQ